MDSGDGRLIDDTGVDSVDTMIESNVDGCKTARVLPGNNKHEMADCSTRACTMPADRKGRTEKGKAKPTTSQRQDSSLGPAQCTSLAGSEDLDWHFQEL
ncbi:hypothetical protein IFM47457_10810 [Aspergillus lentulus]|nr:hypothetical protein IFM47457_10810 [Aspergillus lentulus]